MRIETERLVIRDLERKDQEQLCKIVWQKNIVRFMRDWSENSPGPESFNGYVTEALIALFDWCMEVSYLDYMILTINSANEASCKVAERAGFELYEKRYPINHK